MYLGCQIQLFFLMTCFRKIFVFFFGYRQNPPPKQTNKQTQLCIIFEALTEYKVKISSKVLLH